MHKFYKKYENCILTFIIMLLNVILMGICFDFYYDLNDDTMMKDITSGVYTGTPDGHNMQTLYILGALISLCYRLCRRIPWYGLFLCLCQFGCFYLLGVRLTSLIDRRHGSEREDADIRHRAVMATREEICQDMEYEDGNRAVVRKVKRNRLRGTAWTSKIVVLLVLSLFQWGVCLQHLVNVQYTITCAFMSATAIFLFVTTPEVKNVQQFVVKNIPSILLIIIAYQLRTEMLLLSLPFVALAGMFRWSEEEKIFTKENWKKYGTVVGIMLAGMLLSGCIDFAAYGSAQWQDFQNFFDARTTVYDFYPEVITQDEFAPDMELLGVTSAQRALLRNYNFGLDDAIDSSMLAQIADYATDKVGASRDWGTIFREKCRLYLYRIFHAGDAPYNLIVLWAYAAVLAAGFSSGFVRTVSEGMEKESSSRKYVFIGQMLLLIMVRTAIWMFVLLRGRDPERITHSLYLIEFALLSAGFVHKTSAYETRNYMLHGVMVWFLIIVVISPVTVIQTVQYDQRQREQINQDWQEIDAYCRTHSDNFYFEDVYSTVAFSQKMFVDVNNTRANYDILGGWMCKSPLYQEKLMEYGINSAADGLLNQDTVYFIMSNAEVADRGFDWIIDYYAKQGVSVSVQLSDRINANYAVYQVQ